MDWFERTRGGGPVGGVDEKQVRVAVAVEIQDGHAGTHGFREELFAAGTVVLLETNTRFAGDVGKMHLGSAIELVGTQRLRARERGHRRGRSVRGAGQPPNQPGGESAQEQQGQKRSAQRLGHDLILFDGILGQIEIIRGRVERWHALNLPPRLPRGKVDGGADPRSSITPERRKSAGRLSENRTPSYFSDGL